MSCLFCDQTPETVDAREKLAAIAKMLNCSIIHVIRGVQSILTEQAYIKARQDDIIRERQAWRERAESLQRYVDYREQDTQRLPAAYVIKDKPF